MIYLNSNGIIDFDLGDRGDAPVEEYTIVQYALRVSFKRPFTSSDNSFTIRNPNEEVLDCIVPYSGIIVGDSDNSYPDIVGSVHKIDAFCQDGKLIKASFGTFGNHISDVGFIKGGFLATGKKGNHYRLEFKGNNGTLWCDNRNNKTVPMPKLLFIGRYPRVEYRRQGAPKINIPTNPQPVQPLSPQPVPHKRQGTQQKEQKQHHKQASLLVQQQFKQPTQQQQQQQQIIKQNGIQQRLAPPQLKMQQQQQQQVPQMPQVINHFGIQSRPFMIQQQQQQQQGQGQITITKNYVNNTGTQFQAGPPPQLSQPGQNIQMMQFQNQVNPWQQNQYIQPPMPNFNVVNPMIMQNAGQSVPNQYFIHNGNTQINK